jgi:hypothetical protein
MAGRARCRGPSKPSPCRNNRRQTRLQDRDRNPLLPRDVGSILILRAGRGKKQRRNRRSNPDLLRQNLCQRQNPYHRPLQSLHRSKDQRRNRHKRRRCRSQSWSQRHSQAWSLPLSRWLPRLSSGLFPRPLTSSHRSPYLKDRQPSFCPTLKVPGGLTRHSNTGDLRKRKSPDCCGNHHRHHCDRKKSLSKSVAMPVERLPFSAWGNFVTMQARKELSDDKTAHQNAIRR